MATADFRYTLNYKWDDFVDFTAMLAYEEEFAAREFYGLDLMYPIFMSRDKGNYFRIKLPTYYKKRLKISPFYRSYPTEMRLEVA